MALETAEFDALPGLEQAECPLSSPRAMTQLGFDEYRVRATESLAIDLAETPLFSLTQGESFTKA